MMQDRLPEGGRDAQCRARTTHCVPAEALAAPGVFVLYEVRLKDGTIRKWQLSIRCDDPDHHW
jgi:hypothetical protein